MPDNPNRGAILGTKIAGALVVLALAVVAVYGARRFIRLREAHHLGNPHDDGAAQDAVAAAVARARADVEKFGWHVVALKGEGELGFLYTVGLWQTYKHPELLVFAASEDPSPFLGFVAKLANRIAEGETLRIGGTVEGAFGDLAGATRAVLPRWLLSFVGIAAVYYGNVDFPVTQLYWPDRAGLFPWQSGFDADLFAAQPLLDQENVVLANVGYDEVLRIINDEGARILQTALDNLFLKPEELVGVDLLDEWRWRIGADAEVFQVTLFGDLFLRFPDGHIGWLDTGSAHYIERIAPDQDGWIRVICTDPVRFFHPSTLLHLRSLGYLTGPGEVYSWIRPPMVGGEDRITNLDVVSLAVHLTAAGQLARSIQESSSGGNDVDSAEDSLGAGKVPAGKVPPSSQGT